MGWNLRPGGTHQSPHPVPQPPTWMWVGLRGWTKWPTLMWSTCSPRVLLPRSPCLQQDYPCSLADYSWWMHLGVGLYCRFPGYQLTNEAITELQPSLNSSRPTELNEVVSFVGLSVKATALIVLGVYDNFWDVSVGQFKYPRHLLVVVHTRRRLTTITTHHKPIHLFVLPSRSTLLILGMTWLKLHNQLGKNLRLKSGVLCDTHIVHLLSHPLHSQLKRWRRSFIFVVCHLNTMNSKMLKLMVHRHHLLS